MNSHCVSRDLAFLNRVGLLGENTVGFPQLVSCRPRGMPGDKDRVLQDAGLLPRSLDRVLHSNVVLKMGGVPLK